MAKKKKVSRAKKKSHSHVKKPSKYIHHKPISLKKNVSWTNLMAAVVIVVVLGLFAIVKLTGPSSTSSGEGPSTVAATVNGEAIPLAYINEQFDRLPDPYRSFVTKELILNQTINEVVMLQEAKKRGISASDAEVDAVIAQVVGQSGATTEEFEARLLEQGLTFEYLRSLYDRQIVISKLLNETLFASMSVSEEDVAAFYHGRIRARHILVNTSYTAVELIAKLDKGLDFASLAKDYSTGPSAKFGGDLGEFGSGDMVQAFEEAAFALEVGGHSSEPVETQFGFHVIKRETKEKTLEEQYSEIEAQLLRQMQSAVVPGYVEALRDAAQIEVFGVESVEDEMLVEEVSSPTLEVPVDLPVEEIDPVEELAE